MPSLPLQLTYTVQ